MKVLTLPVLPPAEMDSGTTAAISTRSCAKDAGVYSLTEPSGRRYQLSGMRSQPGLYESVPSGASVMAKKDLSVSLSSRPFGYLVEWLDISAGMKV